MPVGGPLSTSRGMGGREEGRNGGREKKGGRKEWREREEGREEILCKHCQ